jgi:hypothetical protein
LTWWDKNPDRRFRFQIRTQRFVQTQHQAGRGVDAVIERIARGVKEAWTSATSLSQVRGIGIGAPGAVDTETEASYLRAKPARLEGRAAEEGTGKCWTCRCSSATIAMSARSAFRSGIQSQAETPGRHLHRHGHWRRVGC